MSIKNQVFAEYFSRTRGLIEPGAERLEFLFPAADKSGLQRVYTLPCVLVGGTNGKGTVCAFLESMLRFAGVRTGLYTSPHLINANERVRVAGVPVQDKILLSTLEEVRLLSENNLKNATFFEMLTAAAVRIFLSCRVDFAIFEMGLGGKYDSCNAFSPMLSVLTSVGFDHTEILGHELKTIAYDKAHISRRNKPLITGPLDPEAQVGVSAALDKTGAFQISLQNTPGFYLQRVQKLLASLSAEWLKLNLQNLTTALLALFEIEKARSFKIEDNIILDAIKNTFWPGRFDVRTIHNRDVIFDVAHNVSGVLYFLDQYKKSAFLNRRCKIMFSSLQDKDWQQSLQLLADIADEFIFTKITSSRATHPDKFASTIQGKKIQVIENIRTALDVCFYDDAKYCKENDILIVIGSVAFVGEVMETLNVLTFPS